VIRRFHGRGAALCVVFRPAADSRPLPSGYVSSLIEQQFRDALAFEYAGAVTAVIPMGADGEEQLASLLRKLRLVCGVSRPFTDLNESAYAYYQALSALDVGRGIDPDISVYRFEDYILNLLIRNAVADIPVRYFYTDGMSRLAEHDRSSPVSYLDTLRTYLDCSMSIAETARQMHLHRSSLIDRLERITQLLNCDLTDPGVRLALQIVLFADRPPESTGT
jgi:DNA-binding PucR family transcriptional regulator